MPSFIEEIRNDLNERMFSFLGSGDPRIEPVLTTREDETGSDNFPEWLDGTFPCFQPELMDTNGVARGR